MYRRFLTLLSLASLLLVAPTAATFAQSGRLLRVTVPFQFIVKDRSLPAGDYTVEAVSIAGAPGLKMQSVDGHTTALIPANELGKNTKAAEPSLIFSKAADHYVLSQVAGLGENAIQVAPSSKINHHLAKGAASEPKVSVAARRQ